MGRLLQIFLLLAVIFFTAKAVEMDGRFIISPYARYDAFTEKEKAHHNALWDWKDNYGYGLLFEKFLSSSWSTELGFGIINTKKRHDDEDIWKMQIKIINFQIAYNFTDIFSTLIPYFTVSATYVSSLTGPGVGIGLRWILNNRIAITPQVKYIYLWGGKTDTTSRIAFNIMFGGKPKIVDADNDGVLDDKDLCPYTPQWVIVDENGCPVDTDKDGIPDYLDKCADTPEGAKVDENGCPVDSDNDGIPDYADKCPDTPAGVEVDKNGCPVDRDNDGIPDYKDQCLNTPEGVEVDKNGCPIDTDKDGVPDYQDVCLNTPEGVVVDKNGCPIDSDGDGVPDYLDKCQNTIKGAVVDKNGCPLDADKDGVPDAADKCPNTPVGVVVNIEGCPIDSDKDGVPDFKDKCPNTIEGAKVDENGCPADTDKDGVPDYADKCPNTPSGAEVDENGCPLDSDKDGVPNYADKCPNTPENVMIDENGCPLDSDGDGVPDFKDKCPNTMKGVRVDENGCFQSMTLEIHFDTNSAEVKPEYYPLLKKFAQFLKENPSIKVEIQGHTDKRPTSSYEYNMRLSQRRAEAVRKILVEEFKINPKRITAKGYGYTRPIAPNDTEEGRAKNRRIEAVLITDQ